MKRTLIPLLFGLSTILLAPAPAGAQAAGQFEITNIAVEFRRTPDVEFQGDKHRSPPPRKWMEIECEFSAEPPVTEELSVRYYVVINNKMLVGEVAHLRVVKGRERRSCMYVHPDSLEFIMEGRALNASDLQGIATEIVLRGQVLAEKSWKPTPRGRWWTQMPQVPNFLLNKNEAGPFAVIDGERYLLIKSASR